MVRKSGEGIKVEKALYFDYRRPNRIDILKRYNVVNVRYMVQ